MTSFLALSNLMVLIGGILFFITPEMSRRGTLLGVTVAPDFAETAQGRRLLIQYRRRVSIVVLGVLVLMNLAFAAIGEMILLPAITLETVGVFWSWARGAGEARAFAQPTATSIREASLTPRTLPGGWLFLLGPYLIVALAAWFLYSNWESIPETFPVHWQLDGTADGWAHRTVSGVFVPLLSGFFPIPLMTALGLTLIFLTRSANSDRDAVAKDRVIKRAHYFMVLSASYLVSLLLALVSTRPVWANDATSAPISALPFIVGVLLFSGIFLIYLARVSRSPKRGAGDGTPDACWKWGMFYYNPDDPSLLVEKRMGLGWTFNFANKWVWVLTAFTVLPPFVILFSLR